MCNPYGIFLRRGFYRRNDINPTGMKSLRDNWNAENRFELFLTDIFSYHLKPIS